MSARAAGEDWPDAVVADFVAEVIPVLRAGSWPAGQSIADDLEHGGLVEGRRFLEQVMASRQG